MNKYLFWLEKYAAAFFVTILGITFRWKLSGSIPQGNAIYAFWHRNMIPLLYLRKKEGIVILISSSKDGELIAGPAKVLGFQTARGSSNKGGANAFKEILNLAKKYSIAITPDGPKGPMCVAKPGIAHLAYLTKLPIVPVYVHIEKEKLFSSWDKFRLPLPFSWITVTYEEPIFINEKEEINSKLEELQNIMNQKK